MTTDAIEAGARADLLPCPFCGGRPSFESTKDGCVIRCVEVSCWLSQSEIFEWDDENAISLWNRRSSGELVTSAQLAAERERCAKIPGEFAARLRADAKRAREVGCDISDAGGTLDHYADLYEGFAAVIRALPPGPASGEFVVVPREPTDHMVRCGEDGGRKAVGVELSQEGGRKFADAAYRAMLNAATKDGERG